MNRVSLSEIAALFSVTFRNWHKDNVPRMGAALAYYMALSLAPLLVVILAVTGLAFGAKAAQGQLVWQIQTLVGHEGVRLIQSIIAGAHPSSTGFITTVLGLATLFFGGTAVVTELRDALNTIWRVPADPASSHGRSLFNLMKERILAFALVLCAGLFLLTSLIVSTFLSAAGEYLDATPPRAVIQTVEWVVSFAVITALFAFIFKVLPAVRLKWGDVAAGALLTSLMLTAGKSLLAAYLGKAGFTQTYGVAGSLVAFLVWVYYSAQVVFLGAEFTRAYALHFGSMASANFNPAVSSPSTQL